MAHRIIYRVLKPGVPAAIALQKSACRYFATGFQNYVKYEVDFGVHFRAPHGKAVCEDAYFCWDRHGIAAFGVADGVSSWRHEGIDASLFPNALMANCVGHLAENQGKIDPIIELFEKSYQDIMENNQVEAGSSTVCLGILDKKSGSLQTANLGDSGFCIFRNGEVFFKSKEQYLDWNCPAQIGVKEIVDGKSIPHGNSPSDAVVTYFNVQDNDLIIWGTDGLFDNMHPQDIFDIFQQHLPKESVDLNVCSEHLTETALNLSIETKPERKTPREERMSKYNKDLFGNSGGNYDDVTAIIVLIKAK